jgi:hypothetical protein
MPAPTHRRAVTLAPSCQGRHVHLSGASAWSGVLLWRFTHVAERTPELRRVAGQIPELDMEIPTHTQRGTMTTVRAALAQLWTNSVC